MIVVRKGALGDILMTTPAFRELRRRNPNMYIGVRTLFPDVFANSPYVDEASVRLDRNNERKLKLDAEYEKDFNRHPAHVYAKAIVGDCEFDWWNLELFPTEKERLYVDEWWNKNVKDAWPVVVLHYGITWVKLQSAEMEKLIQALTKEFKVILVGRKTRSKEYYPQFREGVLDLVDAEWSIHKLNWLIQKANMFVGTDTGVMHIAATTTTPIVCCYGFVNPEFRKPFRQKIPFESVVGDMSGCNIPFCAEGNKIKCPNGDFGGVRCKRDYACAKSITAEMILEKVNKIKADIMKGQQ